MTVKIDMTIHDQGGLEATVLSKLITRIENVSRNTALIVVTSIGTELDLPPSIVQLAALRVLSYPGSLFWIEEVTSGSKRIIGEIIVVIIGVVLNNTIGESIKEGWTHTRAHPLISASIPKIEDYFVEHFERLFKGPDDGTPDSQVQMDKVAVIEEGDKKTIKIVVRQQRRRPDL